MANSEHLEILEQGVDVWNKWRAENDVARPELRNADLFGTHLNSINFQGTDLLCADLRAADLTRADLSRANLNGINLSDTILHRAVLRRAKLRRANLSGANLGGADLSNATLTYTDFFEVAMAGTVIGNVDLSEAKNLESILHSGPSIVGIDTIYKSRGNIPEEFLRGCGVPENFITYMRSLTGEAHEFYSCFIGFSRKDEDVA